MLKTMLAAALLILAATSALASDVSYDKRAAAMEAQAQKPGPAPVTVACSCKR